MLLIIVCMADAITGRNGLYRFDLVHHGALIALAIGVRSLLPMGRFEKWKHDINDRRRFSGTAGSALGIVMGLGCAVSSGGRMGRQI